MSGYILDTDCFSLWQRNYPSVVERINVNKAITSTTIVTAEELIRGRFHIIRQASQSSQPDRLVSAYTRLWNTLEDFKILYILNFNHRAYAIYTDLRRQKIRIGTQDLRIASIALANNSILVTRNRRDFAKVPDLVIEDWTIQAGSNSL
ncbi:MAG: type II toxin-antitoxin system VapC family toxin [Symploca sp. SIO2D2]|nr:type II toxin-antitoxin system VapC family toxin [Symploca sp. SIO2D2]